MPPYRRPKEVNHQETKYDACVIRVTGKPYRHQAGSGRALALANITDGMTIGQLTEITSGQGFDAMFVVSSLLKQTGAKDCAYLVEPPEGKTLAEIKGTRQQKSKTPEQIAAAEAKAAEAEAKRAARAKAVEEREAAREAAKAAKDAERKAAAEKKAGEKAAAEAAAIEAAKAAAKAASTAPVSADPAVAQAAAPVKGKGKGKKANPEAEAEASANV